MKLQIPDIGTRLTLVCPWEFTLFLESRNQELMAAMLAQQLGHTYTPGDYIQTRYNDEKEEFGKYYTPRPEPVYLVDHCGAERVAIPNPDERRRGHLCPVCHAVTGAMWSNRETVATIMDKDLGTQFVSQRLKGVKIVLPRNTELAIDRIYIRKGQKDFSSVSFLIKQIDSNTPAKIETKFTMPPKKEGGRMRKLTKTHRFWARLEDVNHIDCDLL